jgi:TatD DNase family protein
MLIDTHCHIQFNTFKDDWSEVVRRCQDKEMILNVVGSQMDTSRRAVELARQYDFIYATVGLHPVHLFSTHVDEEEVMFKTREEKFDYDAYRELALDPKTIAIGECGLELFHLPKDVDRLEVLARQEEGFLAQYRLAQDCNLPLVIHVRDAHLEMIALLEKLSQSIRGVVHCFTGNWEQAKKYLDLGLYLGFTGVVTFSSKKTNPTPQLELLEVIKNCPLERMLVETDSPYLAPQAYRGERCEPWMTKEVVKKIAEIKGMSEREIVDITVKNACQLFTRIK